MENFGNILSMIFSMKGVSLIALYSALCEPSKRLGVQARIGCDPNFALEAFDRACQHTLRVPDAARLWQLETHDFRKYFIKYSYTLE